MIRNVLISLVIMIIFACYSIFKLQGKQQFQITAIIPSTSPGEIGQLYKKSPFMDLRVATSSGEKFEDAVFFVTTDNKIADAELEKNFLTFLQNYYDTRVPIEDFENRVSKKVTQIKKEIKEKEHDLALELEQYAIIKAKYKQFTKEAFGNAESEVLSTEIAILNLKNKIHILYNKKNDLFICIYFFL